MSVTSDIDFQAGQAAWVYMTFTNPDAVTGMNPDGLVDADPVNMTVMDIHGALTTGLATHLSLGYYRYLVSIDQGGGSYVVHAAGSGLGRTTEDVVLRVGLSIVGG